MPLHFVFEDANANFERMDDTDSNQEKLDELESILAANANNKKSKRKIKFEPLSNDDLSIRRSKRVINFIHFLYKNKNIEFYIFQRKTTKLTSAKVKIC